MTRYAVIGCGQRAKNLVRMLARHPEVSLAGAWDPRPEAVNELVALGPPDQTVVRATTWQELLDGAHPDWVMVASPNAQHRDHIEGALARGCHVFAEKPLATSEEDCLALARLMAQTDRQVMTGFTLRYAPLYREVKRLIDEGTLGHVISIDANENLSPGHGAYIFTNWRRFHDQAGAHILEKCVHDLDLLGWFTGSRPRRVAAFGGNALFVPAHAGLYEQHRAVFDQWPATRQSGLNPFTTEKTIEDTLVSILEYENGARVQFQLTSSNALGERRMFLSGTAGTLVVDLVQSCLRYRRLGDSADTLWSGGEGFHGGGDEVMIGELVSAMTSGTPPSTGLAAGITSTLVGLGLDRARREGQVIDLSATWSRLDAALSSIT